MARKANVVEIPSLGTLDRTAGQLGRQLAQALRSAIRRGDLKPGELLPSTRILGKSLTIARGTVIEAFEQLIAEGFLESQGRAGTRVARSLADASPTTRQEQGRPTEARSWTPSARIERFAQVARQFAAAAQIPFSVSVPIGKAAPDDIWRRLGNRIRARGAGAPSGYGDPQGALELREAVADYVRKSRSVRCEASQVIITSGTQQGLYLACQVLLDVGDFAWVEDPAYRGITGILESAGHSDQMIRVPVDAEGLNVESGIAQCPQARAAFVTSSHQYPLGMPMSMARRDALLAWARASDAWIVEDDYDSELRYAGHPFPSLQGLDPDRVIYLGTFSKILFPSLRLGYAIVPPYLVQAFCGARALMDRHPANADQHVLAAFIAEGHLDRHIRRIRGVYADIHKQIIEAVARLIPRELAWLEPSDQGMHLVLWLAEGIDDQWVAAKASEAQVSVRAVSPMYAGGNGRSGLILGLGGFSAEDIDSATRRLAQVITLAAKPSAAGSCQLPQTFLKQLVGQP
ncbi:MULTISPECIES: MocR-like pyridoxine biosynthesis transcription factor PdxR [Pseudomonas]|uniref:MocR-like pyridoxine biosynthesis transcription factor PdxR n=1 Tax=Pseudomonas TaxID=286 RepID=UPI000B35A65B|nr:MULTISPECIES: PLP-dependent aminotransferase family protein [Pseudomonas]PMY48933.1 PLP-dependent aminotransferase family protein [Pseudomonas sp. FW305-53]PMY84684.1 PLP-dependent aminotransferase family protein [Pseudomonas sp. FW303-C2]PMY90486.1 PLP-dependent aminotransferase family protein [Pseudomonas sp. FW305-62]PNA44940.1 PLP-dependent aminotransferase family protein [Pseudomonas sp. FW306-2-2C-A10BC]PNA83508.1 PLP-dependent aminotransferase family protein [Pseudomonas sp. MPR-R3B]